jgi:hypothetical protein
VARHCHIDCKSGWAAVKQKEIVLSGTLSSFFRTSRSDGWVLGAGSHLVRVLDSEVTQATDAPDRDEIARQRARLWRDGVKEGGICS